MHIGKHVCRQIRMGIYLGMSINTHIRHTYVCIYPHMHGCVTQGCSLGRMKSLVHALGADSSMTEPTINSTLDTFIEQVNFYDLQKMVLQFTICFVPTMGYTSMVYTLRISAQSSTKIDVYSLKSCCVVYQGT